MTRRPLATLTAALLAVAALTGCAAAEQAATDAITAAAEEKVPGITEAATALATDIAKAAAAEEAAIKVSPDPIHGVEFVAMGDKAAVLARHPFIEFTATGANQIEATVLPGVGYCITGRNPKIPMPIRWDSTLDAPVVGTPAPGTPCAAPAANR